MKSLFATPLRMLANLVLVYVAYEICRFVFLFENWQVFAPALSWPSLLEMLRGGFVFDTSAILYTNALYILLMILPLHYRESDLWQRVARWVFIVCNTACVAANLADAVYFQYTARRTTATVFHEFSNEGNLGGIVGIEMLRHWYLVLIAVVLVWGLWRFYFKPPKDVMKWLHGRTLIPYYIYSVAFMLVFVPVCVCGMRGGATTAVRPITISNANQYAARPQEAAVVLNTPFAIIRTFGKSSFVVPTYYATSEELASVYSPLHVAADTISPKRKNVVVIIVESFGREYIGGFNKWLDGGGYKGYTPFIDSLMEHSVTYEYSYCNGRKSIDGMPSVLSSIPMFVEPFFLTPSSMNDVSGLARELGYDGYQSAFFHGAENGSMGFQAFARSTGFQRYYGRTEYNADKRFNGDDDFDGTWAIWDEPFMQFYALKMTEMKQPFVTALFTASSHHPFVIPDEYKETFPEEGLPIHKCIRYTDNALRRFFDTAKRQPWYANTIFVITSDHTNMSDHEYYQTALGGFCSPIIFFDPSGELKAGMRKGIAQQIDIMPTVLTLVGHKRPYVAFGIDLFNTPADRTWAVNYLAGIYQYVRGDYLLQFDGQRTKGFYRFRTDLLLKDDLAGRLPQQAVMERELKAIIQSYMTRMTTNQLVTR